MDHRHGAFNIRIVQLLIELRDLPAHEQSLVGDGAGGETGNIKPVIGTKMLRHAPLGLLAEDVQLAVQRGPRHPLPGNEHLHDERLVPARFRPQHTAVGGHITGTDEFELLIPDNRLHCFQARRTD